MMSTSSVKTSSVKTSSVNKMSREGERGSNWLEAEKLCLLAIWEREDTQEQLDGTIRDGKVYRKICEEMDALGYPKTKAQVVSRVKKWKRDYKNVIDNRGKTGRGRISCDYFDRLDQVLGHRPAVNPPEGRVMESCVPEEPSQVAASTSTSTSSPKNTDPVDPADIYVDEDTTDDEDFDAEASEESVTRPTVSTDTSRNGEGKRKCSDKTPQKGKRVKRGPAALVHEMFESFIQHQRESEAHFWEMEERTRLREERFLAEQRERDREHEIRLIQLLSHSQIPQLPVPVPHQHINYPNHIQKYYQQPSQQDDSSIHPTYTNL